MWGLEPGTSQAVISKQECRSRYFPEMLANLNQNCHYICLSNSWYRYISLIYLFILFNIFFYFYAFGSKNKYSTEKVSTVI